MAAILDQGATAIRDALKTLVSHVGLSTDQTAFSAAHTSLSPGGGTELIKASSEANVDATTFDATIDVDGSIEFTNQTIWTIGLMDGAASGDAMSRSVRTQGIGVQAFDIFTVGVRVAVQDNSA